MEKKTWWETSNGNQLAIKLKDELTQEQKAAEKRFS